MGIKEPNVSELKKALDKMGIDYPRDALKKDLQKLVAKNSEPVPEKDLDKDIDKAIEGDKPEEKTEKPRADKLPKGKYIGKKLGKNKVLIVSESEVKINGLDYVRISTASETFTLSEKDLIKQIS